MQSHTLSPSALLRSILLERLSWRALILGLSLLAAVLGILAPYAQKHFADDLLAGHPAQIWIWAAFALTLSAQALSQLSIWLAMRESLITQKALGDGAYDRILEGPGGLIGRRPAGEAVSLFAVDVPGAAAILDQTLVMACSMVFPLLLAPFALKFFFGIPVLATIGAIACLASINFVLARKQSGFFRNFKQLAAERTGLVAEWIQNIRTLRILGWIGFAEDRIFEVRSRETKNRKIMVTNGQLMNAIASTSTFALNILAVVLLLNIRGPGSQPSAGELLSLLWILGVFLARPIRQFPWVFVIGMDSLTSIKRLEKALNLPIHQPRVREESARGAGVEPAGGTFALEVRGLNLESSEGKSLLKDIDLVLKPGELVAIVGEVGSGKSLLLQSLVGATGASFARFALDAKPTRGPVDSEVRVRMAFVPQEGFTMNASLRENIAFDYLKGAGSDALDAVKGMDAGAMASLKAAQFRLDREGVADGLDTEIGERGVNLSGGQRQRIGLARAHFAGRPIVVLDDCLSAVDVDTERKLIDELICGEWSAKTRLIATHRMAILPQCDRVIFMREGEIALQGTYSQLLRQSGEFREFVRREAVKAEETSQAQGAAVAGSTEGSTESTTESSEELQDG